MMRRTTALLLAAIAVGGCNDNADSKAKEKKAEEEAKPEVSAAKPPEPPTPPARPGKPEVPAPEDVAAAPADAKDGTSGIKWKQLEQPTSEDAPRSFDRIKMEFVLWGAADGRMLDRSREDSPAELFVHQARPGWSELLQEMKVGEKRRAWIPEEVAKGGRPGLLKGGMTLDVKLLGVERMPEPPSVPEDVAEAPASAAKTATGLATRVIKRGTGKVKPTPRDRVKVNYTGWTSDGKMFDSSIPRGQPTTFGVTQVIPGWSEGVQLMVEGETRRMWIPQGLAYRGAPGAPAGTLVFDVELLEIEKPPEPPKTPKDVAKAPKNAQKTASGLASVVLQKGKGDKHPGATSEVEVHYSGWTTDGKMFDSSVTRGKPITFRLDRVIPGWTEGVQLMVEGEKRRLWIPEELAYKGRPGSPQGMLVFDVELLSIK